MLLVAVPLAFELVFVSTLYFFLVQAEQEAMRQEHSKAIITCCADINRSLTQGGVALALYATAKSQAARERLEREIGEYPRLLAQLQKLVEDDPKQKAVCAEFKTDQEKATLIVNDVKRKLDTEDGGLSDFVSGIEMRRKMKIIGEKTAKQLTEIVKLEKDKGFSSDADVRFRANLKLMLLIGVVSSIAVAAGLAIWINSGTTTRLAQLMENTYRFASDKPLLPVVSGTDEITHLDKAFHKMASELSRVEEMKKEFIAMITHDLRTPLTSLQITLEILASNQNTGLKDDWKKRAQKACESTERLILLINDLLDAEKISAGKLDLEIDVVSVDRLVEKSLASLQAFADRAKVSLVQEKSNLLLMADGARIVQVLINLISNSVKFSPPDSTITISATAADKMVKISVKDQGRGIPPGKLPYIFDRFEQVKPQDATEKGGTGLGLAICKSIVESHGGRIGVESVEGDGSTFWFLIPAAESDIE